MEHVRKYFSLGLQQWIAPLVKVCFGEWENSNPSFLQKENTSSFSSPCETHLKKPLYKKIINTFFNKEKKNIIFNKDGQYFGEDMLKFHC